MHVEKSSVFFLFLNEYLGVFGCPSGRRGRCLAAGAGLRAGRVPGGCQGWGHAQGCHRVPCLLLGQVLSHNLYTVLRIPHDPVALEEHFRDDDDGPVSSQGYMPYLNKYILDKVSPCAPAVPALSRAPGAPRLCSSAPGELVGTERMQGALG